MKKILVTGASGYIGARLCLHLSNIYQVTALCYPELKGHNFWKNKMEEVLTIDLCDEVAISHLSKNKFDIIIHLVSLDHRMSESDPNMVSKVNVMPTWNLLNEFSKNMNLTRFIYFSTFQVYGKVNASIIDEEVTTAPTNSYGLTHLMSENICNYFNISSIIECINVRLTNSYGSPVFKENNCWWLVINDLCKSAFKEKKIQLNSDGSPQRDFIHSFDIFKAIDLLINCNLSSSSSNVFNLSSGKTLTILEIAHAIKNVYKEIYKSDIPVLLKDGTISLNEKEFSNVPRYKVDNNKLCLLGFKPEIGLEDGIHESFEFIEKSRI
jgi:UDP-glucose 4-epimerase